MENDESVHDVRAVTQLWICWEALKDITKAVRYMLDDVIVAAGLPEKSDVLTAWNDGQENVKMHREHITEAVTGAIDFMDTDDFQQIDGAKKADYWETLSSTEKALVTLDKQLRFYQFLSRIEHAEQTVGFLWQLLKQERNTILYRQCSGTLASRWLALHKRQLEMTQNRLQCEIHTVMRLIDQAAKHPHFESMHRQKQEEYLTKWKAYAKGLQDIEPISRC